MHAMVEEYGALVIAIICVSMFLFIFHRFIYGDADDTTFSGTSQGSLAFVYKSDIVDVGIFESSDLGNRDMSHAAGSSKVTYAPHFHALNKTEDGATVVDPDKHILDKSFTQYYKIRNHDADGRAIFTYDDAIAIFKPITPGVKTGIWLDDAEEVPYTGPVTITYARYDVALDWYEDDGVTLLENPRVIYEKVQGTDKYGNTKDKNGNPYPMRDQVKYNRTFVGELTPTNPIKVDINGIGGGDAMAEGKIPPRYKLTYRIEVGNKKAEFQTMILLDDIGDDYIQP